MLWGYTHPGGRVKGGVWATSHLPYHCHPATQHPHFSWGTRASGRNISGRCFNLRRTPTSIKLEPLRIAIFNMSLLTAEHSKYLSSLAAANSLPWLSVTTLRCCRSVLLAMSTPKHINNNKQASQTHNHDSLGVGSWSSIHVHWFVHVHVYVTNYVMEEGAGSYICNST